MLFYNQLVSSPLYDVVEQLNESNPCNYELLGLRVPVILHVSGRPGAILLARRLPHVRIL